MRMKGQLANDDYLAFGSYGNQPDYDVFSWVPIVVFSNLVLSVALCYLLDTRSPVMDGSLLSGMAWASVILLRSLMLRGARRSARRHGFYNLGEATYELGDRSLRFAGTTFSCDIPYRSMLSVIQYHDKAAIVFSPITGFLLPGRGSVTEGDLDAFVKELRKRLEAERPDGSAAATLSEGEGRERE